MISYVFVILFQKLSGQAPSIAETAGVATQHCRDAASPCHYFFSGGSATKKNEPEIKKSTKNGKGAIAFKGKLLDIVTIKQAENIVNLYNKILEKKND